MDTEILKVDPINPDIKLLSYCAQVIRNGGLIAFPTETVYGLGACIYIEKAVKRIYLVKNRPMDNPLIIHIANLNQLYEVVREVPRLALKLIENAWPGPLTLIFKKSDKVPYIVTGGLETVAVRMPAHPVALKLIELSDCPIAAPSANLAGKPSPTNARHVINDLYDKIEVIIDAGDTFFGVESTILNVTEDPPVLLRPGPLPLEKLKEIIGTEIIVPDFARGLYDSKIALSPGTKYRHYAPSKPLILVESRNYKDLKPIVFKIRELCNEFKSKGKKVMIIATRETYSMYEGCKTIIIGSRNNLYEVARNLYKILRMVDELDIDIAIIEGFEEKGIGLAIMNRLRKASGSKITLI